MTASAFPRPFNSILAALVSFSALLLINWFPVAAAVIRVPNHQPTIQAGIDAAQSGDTVLVADGTYTGVGNRDIDLLGKAIIVTSENGPENCIIDLEGGAYRGFDLSRGEGPDSWIQGFTISGADFSDSIYDYGGGIRLFSASPVIRGNRIIDNTIGVGAGIACLEGSDPLIEGNFIEQNYALDAGGAVYAVGSSPVIRGNQVLYNHCGYFAGGGYGGGIYCGDQTLVEDNVIAGNAADPPDVAPYDSYGGGVYAFGSAVVTGNLLTNNYSAAAGGGIYCHGTNLISGNIVENTRAGSAIAAGGINYGGSAEAAVTHNIVRNNNSHGIECDGDNLLANNLVYGNAGYGLYCQGEVTLLSCTVAHNTSLGLMCERDSDLTVIDSIIWGNNGSGTAQISIGGGPSHFSLLDISYCDVEGGEVAVEYDPNYVSISWGTGMIDAPPLFAGGGLSDYYLGQVDAGQSAESPCVDAGSALAEDICVPSVDTDLCLDQLITRTDLVADTDTADMGFHHRPTPGEPDTFITEGPDYAVDSPLLNFTFTGSDDLDLPAFLVYSHRIDKEEWSGYSSSTIASISGLSVGYHVFAVRARDSQGNVDPTPALRPFTWEPWTSAGSWQNIVTGPGPGPINPPLVRTSQGQWLAYGVVRYGVNVACGDIDGDGTDEVITGPGPGQTFGPHVRCFQPDGQVVHGAGFQAYGTLNFGVNVAAGDIDGDGFDEIITGAGPGAVFGPHVRGWNNDGDSATLPIPEISYFAYGTLRWGVNVACGDIDGDGIDEIITGAGPGPVFGPHVRGWNWDGSGAVTPIPEVSFFAYGTIQHGVNVACGDLDDDGFDEIFTGAGPNPAHGAHVRGWDWDGSGKVVPMPGVSYMAFNYYNHGAVVAGGDVDGDGRDDIVAAPGPSPDHAARVYARERYPNGNLHTVANFTAYDYWMRYGCRVAVGKF